MFTIVGLENEGGRGTWARHAVGARFVDYVFSQGGFKEWSYHQTARSTVGIIGTSSVSLLVQTSGKLHNCGEVLRPYLLETADAAMIFIAYDEADFEMGESRFRYSNTSSQLGIQNMVRFLKTDQFTQLAIGIGAIPRDSDMWEEFFNGRLSEDERARLGQEVFPQLFESIQIELEGNAKGYRRPTGISSHVMQQAQLPVRRGNLVISPVIPVLSHKQADWIKVSVQRLSRIIQETAKKYARLCHETSDPGSTKLGTLLESAVPAEMVSLVRNSQFHIDHLGFDFQAGKLIEINAASYPPLFGWRIGELLGYSGSDMPGVEPTLELVTTRVRILADRHRLGGREGTIHILNRVGDAVLGVEGWQEHVQEYLVGKGYLVSVGGINESADVIWANLTWMTSDRWQSVITQSATKGVAQIFPSPRNFLFTSKAFLATLSSSYGRRVLELSQSDGDLLDMVVPWSRILDDELDTVHLLLRNGIRLYAKPVLSSGGRGGRTVRESKHLQKIERPAIVQEWSNPYSLTDSNGQSYSFDVRVVVYGGDKKQVWGARVWQGSSTLQRPLDAPIAVK